MGDNKGITDRFSDYLFSRDIDECFNSRPKLLGGDFDKINKNVF